MPCGCALLAYLGLSMIQDNPPRTLEIQIDSWQNQSWGLHDIERQRISCKIAISANGSRLNECEHQSFRHYFMPNAGGTERTLYLAPENMGFRLDDSRRVAAGGQCRCTWQRDTTTRTDGECRDAPEQRLTSGKRVGTGQIGGHPVVHYLSVEEQGSETWLSLAPELGCEVMEEVITWPGTVGVPGARWRYRVISYKAGDPDPGLFQLPTGYAVEKTGR